MKRSEMIELIAKQMLIHDIEDYGTIVIAKRVLEKIEQAGMLPPAIKGLTDHHWDSDRGGYSKPVYEWETEEKKETADHE